jgi:small subunit ribosomal protein S17
MNSRRRLTGTVVSKKMQKTVVVNVSRTYRHPLYHKVVRTNKVYKAHDELDCNVGDKVRIVETQPISRTKRWAVEEVLKVEFRQEDMVDEPIETVLEQATQEVLQEEVQETVEAVEEPVEETIETVAEETVEETTEAAEEIAEEAAEATTEESVEEVVEEAVDETVEDAAEEE